MTRKEIRFFWEGIQAIITDDLDRKLAYAIARNRSRLRSVVEAIEEASKPVPAFEKKRVELAREMAQKDGSGNPIMMPDQKSFVVADMVTFNEKLETIRKSTKQTARDKQVEKFMEEKEEVDIYQVPFELFPDTIRPDIMEALLPMVEEEEKD